MLPTKEFEKRKIKVNIDRYGQDAKFYCFEKNRFGEEDKEKIKVEKVVKAILHIEKSYVQRNTADASVTRSKFVPMLLCMHFSEVIESHLDFYVEVNNKKYKVSGLNDVAESGYALDVSLEEVM